MSSLFISYAREDADMALRIYRDLEEEGLRPWLAQESLLPGEPWELAIKNAIRNSRYFVALLSNESVGKKGYVQKELRQGIDCLEELPDSAIFLIPVRLDRCEPSHRQLRHLNWLDLFPDYDKGMGKLVDGQ